MRKIILVALLVTLSACGNSEHNARAKGTAAALAELKATSAYGLVVAESGKEVDPSDPIVKHTALVLFDASKFFEATEKDIANVAYYHAKQARANGINVNAVALMEAGMKAFKEPNQSLGAPSLKSFNLFGTWYQVQAINNYRPFDSTGKELPQRIN